MIRKSLLALAALALASTTALAASPAVEISKDGTRVTVPRGVGHTYYRPGVQTPGLATIFSNIGYKYPNGLYFCCYGATVGGPSSGVGQIWIAQAFTPASSMTVHEISASIGCHLPFLSL